MQLAHVFYPALDRFWILLSTIYFAGQLEIISLNLNKEYILWSNILIFTSEIIILIHANILNDLKIVEKVMAGHRNFNVYTGK